MIGSVDFDQNCNVAFRVLCRIGRVLVDGKVVEIPDSTRSNLKLIRSPLRLIKLKIFQSQTFSPKATLLGQLATLSLC